MAAALARAGIAPERLTLEVTETGLVSDPLGTTAVLEAVRALGCQVAIDDFGTGHSSLSRLVDLPACVLKVDREFTRQLPGRTAAVAVVAAVLELGRQLDRTVVVEGVEDQPTLQSLRGLGVSYAQGYHLGRPVAPERIVELVGG